MVGVRRDVPDVQRSMLRRSQLDIMLLKESCVPWAVL